VKFFTFIFAVLLQFPESVNCGSRHA